MSKCGARSVTLRSPAWLFDAMGGNLHIGKKCVLPCDSLDDLGVRVDLALCSCMSLGEGKGARYSHAAVELARLDWCPAATFLQTDPRSPPVRVAVRDGWEALAPSLLARRACSLPC